MIGMFRALTSKRVQEDQSFTPRIEDDQRVYAIGDIHGRSDLLDALFVRVVEDSASRGPVAEVRVVLLGDLIDRGPDSRGVITRAMAIVSNMPGACCLMGNHEEIFLQALGGHAPALDFFRRMGRETLLSYGIAAELIDTGGDEHLHAAMLEHVPEPHRDFLGSLPNSLLIGDYLFVHAGIKPGVPINAQAEGDLRWIRGPFLKSRQRHPHMIVHGHSISTKVDEQPNRIGIDTGAYASGHLTAIGLQGADRWYIST